MARSCNKTGRWPALFLTLTLPCGSHYTTLHSSTLPCGGHFITLHYSTLLYFTLGQSFHYFTLLYTTGDIILYSTLHVYALWWQVVISLSRLLCGIQPLWLCGPYHDLLCVWELKSCHSLSVRTVVTPFSILWESSMTCAVRTLCFSFMLIGQLYLCLTLHYPILYFWLRPFPLLYVRFTLHYPILGCGHTLSLRRCGDCLICVFLILYLYNVVGGDCGPHFVFTPRILRVTWVSKPLLTLPLLDIISTRHYPYSTLHDLPTLLLLSPQGRL